MPEPGTTAEQPKAPPTPTPDRAASQDSMQLTISRIVLNTPGVVRLEPTLSSAGPKMLVNPSPADGIQVRNRNNIVEIDVSIATQTTHEARRVARDVHNKVTAAIAKLERPGTIKVNVLTIEETDN